MAQQPSTPRKRHRLTKPIRASVVALIVGLFSLPADTLSGQEDVSAAIVRLTATTTDGYSKTGSGFVVALQAGTANVVTAAHVVTGSQNVVAEFSTDLSGAYKAEIFRVDSKIDLALLRISNPPAATKALLISARAPKAGAVASVVGFPQRAPKLRFATVTVSSQEGSRLALTGLVDSGSSGSPVLQGDVVVGLVTDTQGLYPSAVSGPMLRLVLESWLPADLLPMPRSDPRARLPTKFADLVKRDIKIVSAICEPAKRRHRIGLLRDHWKAGWRPSMLPFDLPIEVVHLTHYAEAREAVESKMVVRGPATDEAAAKLVCGKLSQSLDEVEKGFLK